MLWVSRFTGKSMRGRPQLTPWNTTNRLQKAALTPSWPSVYFDRSFFKQDILGSKSGVPKHCQQAMGDDVQGVGL